jgi:uncharacterized protein (UPF0297 family)
MNYIVTTHRFYEIPESKHRIKKHAEKVYYKLKKQGYNPTLWIKNGKDYFPEQ